MDPEPGLDVWKSDRSSLSWGGGVLGSALLLAAGVLIQTQDAESMEAPCWWFSLDLISVG